MLPCRTEKVDRKKNKNTIKNRINKKNSTGRVTKKKTNNKKKTKKQKKTKSAFSAVFLLFFLFILLGCCFLFVFFLFFLDFGFLLCFFCSLWFCVCLFCFVFLFLVKHYIRYVAGLISVHIPKAKCWTQWHSAFDTWVCTGKCNDTLRGKYMGEFERPARAPRDVARGPREVWPTQPHPGNSKQTANRIIHCTSQF